ncbi:DUF922 domain-containing Zn-dependent protease [Pararhizobium sp.]|uniref:DUF922 domain-containing Zn-dependent protease n=1 Tax=Pararhizobium sp. TaxID=1977563 RepID=UPI00271FC117|nr:DUF922 domain-containing protein [Pararhizobium sp.]MDO9418466.1 DUF922 domain-containing protein [Pararhizobium sp.]
MTVAAQSGWQAIEKIETYAIEGTTGAELYASIGAHGPQAGGLGRAIAYTTFKLTWTRNYQPQGTACVLVSARPKLTLIYKLPKPAKRLQGEAAALWNVFLAGVTAHEKIHGDFIRDMVGEIERVSVGLSVPNDPKCRKIRTELTARLGQISLAQRQRSRDFDRAELSAGGNVHQLILQLVNQRRPM